MRKFLLTAGVLVASLLGATSAALALTVNSVSIANVAISGGVVCLDVTISFTVTPSDVTPAGPIHVKLGENDPLDPDEISSVEHEIYFTVDPLIFSDPTVTSVTYVRTYRLCFTEPAGWRDAFEGADGEWYVTAWGNTGGPHSSNLVSAH